MSNRSEDEITATVVAQTNDGVGDTLVETIVSTVSELEARSPAELPPLYDAVDPDALVSLFDWGADGASQGYCGVSFEYSDSVVLVERGSVTVSTSTLQDPHW